MIRRIKIFIKILIMMVLILVVSLIVINILKPIPQKKVSNEYKKQESQLKYQADTPRTERILCIDENEDALLWRLRMISAAKKSIVLATFDFRADKSGMNLMAALHHAAEKGIRIKLLIDGIYQPLYLRGNESFDALCGHENIEVKFYNPIKLRSLYDLNYRMHDKYIMIDHRMYLLGGRNTTDTFLGKLHKGSNIDRELLVYNEEDKKGESFEQLEDYFLKIWKEKASQELPHFLKNEVKAEKYKEFKERYPMLLEKYGRFDQYDSWKDSTYQANKITLISNGIEAKNKEPRVLYTIEQLAAKADKVMIQTPYIISNQYMDCVLQNIGKKADLKIFINAVEKGSNPWGCTDYLNNKNKILGTGADVYEVMNEYAVHTKAVLIDENISIIGSYNLDMRSTYLDTELMLIVDSKRLNTCIRSQMDQYAKKSIEVLSDGTQTKGSLYEEKKMTAKKECIYHILRVVVRPFRHLL